MLRSISLLATLVTVLLSVGCQSAPSYVTTTSIQPGVDAGTYLVQIQALEVHDGVSQAICMPSVVCRAGEPAEIYVGAEDRSEHFTARVLVPAGDEPREGQVDIQIRRAGRDVYESHESIVIERPTP